MNNELSRSTFLKSAAVIGLGAVAAPALTNTAVAAPIAGTKNVFKDVKPSHGFAREIKWAKDKGITKGYADGTFRPNNEITRVDAVVMMYRALDGQPVKLPKSSPFSDISPKYYAYKEIIWAYKLGIVPSTRGSRFEPKSLIRRDVMMGMLAEFIGEPTNGVRIEGRFKDVGLSNPYAAAIAVMNEYGFTNGYEDNTFRSAGAVTRADLVAFLYRMANSFKEAVSRPDK